jgi:hypothetical protein
MLKKKKKKKKEWARESTQSRWHLDRPKVPHLIAYHPGSYASANGWWAGLSFDTSAVVYAAA